MDQLLGDAVAQPRLNAAVIASFAVIALLLACVGIYGVVSYLAAQRTQEIGVRMALGATRGDITRFFVRRAMVPAAIGLATGTVVSLVANRLLRSQLYGVQPDDLRLYLCIPAGPAGAPAGGYPQAGDTRREDRADGSAENGVNTGPSLYRYFAKTNVYETN